MKPYQIEVINDQSKVFQIVSAVIGVVFGWAGINITWTLANNYEDVTFGSLLVAAPLFTVGLLSLLCFWFVRMTAATNYLLAELLEASRQHHVASDSNSGPATRQTALTQRPGVLERMVGAPDVASDLTSEPGAPEKICAVTGCGRNSQSGHALCRSHLGLD